MRKITLTNSACWIRVPDDHLFDTKSGERIPASQLTPGTVIVAPPTSTIGGQDIYDMIVKSVEYDAGTPVEFETICPTLWEAIDRLP